MTEKHQKQIEATKKQVAKLLDLDDDEKEILDAGMNIVATISASEQGEKMNRQLREEFRKGVKDE